MACCTSTRPNSATVPRTISRHSGDRFATALRTLQFIEYQLYCNQHLNALHMYSFRYGWDKSEQNSINMNLSAWSMKHQACRATGALKRNSTLFRNFGIRHEHLALRSIRFVSRFIRPRRPCSTGFGTPDRRSWRFGAGCVESSEDS